MMRKHSTPFGELGFNDFMESYRSFFDVRSEISGFEKSIIVYRAEAFYLYNFKNRDLKLEHRAFRAALHILNTATTKKQTSKVVAKVAQALDLIPYALTDTFSDRAPSNPESINLRDLITKQLDAYTTTYEVLFRLVYGPIVYAYKLDRNVRDESAFRLDSSGLARIGAIREIETSFSLSFDFFLHGVNSALRNARAHRHYEILEDDNNFEYWGNSTSRTRMTKTEVSELCDQLLINSSAILDALLVWFINNQKVAYKRQWIREKRPIKLNTENYKRAVESLADIRGFNLISFSRDKGTETDSFQLETNPKGIDQNSQIFRGGDDWTESFDVEVTIHESLIVKQIVLLLVDLCWYSPPNKVVVEIKDWKKKHRVGSIKTKFGVIRSFRKQQKLGKVRRGFEEDSLGEAMMWVETKSDPIRVTPRILKNPRKSS